MKDDILYVILNVILNRSIQGPVQSGPNLDLDLDKRPGPGLTLNCQAQVQVPFQVPGQVPGQVQVQSRSGPAQVLTRTWTWTKFLDLG